MAAKKAGKKGTEGKGTGGKARAAIKKAVGKGATLKKIGAATNRDSSTIGAILGGRIKNPPKGLAAKIAKVKPAKGAKPAKSKPKGSKATAAFKSHR